LTGLPGAYIIIMFLNILRRHSTMLTAFKHGGLCCGVLWTICLRKHNYNSW